MVSKQAMLDILERIAPNHLAMDWDNTGLILDAKEGLQRLLICLDVTDAVLQEAVEKQIDLIVSHHPLIFDPLKRVESDNIVFKTIQSGISVYAAHTNMDVVEGGLNDTLAVMLGVHDCKPLSLLKEHAFGCIGNLDENLMVSEFAEVIEKKLGFTGIRVAGLQKKKIKRIAVASGSGGDSVWAAKCMGADALVTGEAKHNQYIDAVNTDLVLFEAGHYHTEKHFVNLMAKHLQEAANQLKYNLQVIISEREDPPYVTKI